MNGLGDGVFHKAVQRHVVGRGGNHRLPVQFRRNADIKAPFVGPLWLLALLGAQLQVIVHRTMKIRNQLVSLIRNHRSDAQNLAIEQSIFLRKLHTAEIAFVFHRIIHRSPSCSEASKKCFAIYQN